MTNIEEFLYLGLARMRTNWIFHTLLAGIKNVSNNLEDILALS